MPHFSLTCTSATVTDPQGTEWLLLHLPERLAPGDLERRILTQYLARVCRAPFALVSSHPHQGWQGYGVGAVVPIADDGRVGAGSILPLTNLSVAQSVPPPGSAWTHRTWVLEES